MEKIYNKRKIIRSLLKEFWLEKHNGANHLCVLPTEKNRKDFTIPMTINEATEKILRICGD